MRSQLFYTLRFQSTLPRGERLVLSINSDGQNEFQSTLPRGERHHTGDRLRSMQHFNPRSREGSDQNRPRLF